MFTCSSFARIGAACRSSARSSPVHTQICTHAYVYTRADRYTPRPDADYHSDSPLCYLAFSIFNGSVSSLEKEIGQAVDILSGHFDIQAFLFLVSVRFSVLVTRSVKTVCNFCYLTKTERFWHFFGFFSLARFWVVLTKNFL